MNVPNYKFFIFLFLVAMIIGFILGGYFYPRPPEPEWATITYYNKYYGMNYTFWVDTCRGKDVYYLWKVALAQNVAIDSIFTRLNRLELKNKYRSRF